VTNSRPFALIVAAGVVLFVVLELLRRRQLREKYAALWVVVSGALLFFAARPDVFARISRFLGFGLPANLAFASAVVVLLLVSMQLSLESGRREDETQRLAEEVALLRLELGRLRSAGSGNDAPASGAGD
jgi:hypothetical protein